VRTPGTAIRTGTITPVLAPLAIRAYVRLLLVLLARLAHGW